MKEKIWSKEKKGKIYEKLDRSIRPYGKKRNDNSGEIKQKHLLVFTYFDTLVSLSKDV